MSRENVEIAREAWKAFTDQGVGATLDYYAGPSHLEARPQCQRPYLRAPLRPSLELRRYETTAQPRDPDRRRLHPG
jgi:hypothetical protein